MSSPQLNNLIIIGCMLTYTSVVFLGLDSGLSSVGKLINPKFPKKFNNSRIAKSVMAQTSNLAMFSSVLFLWRPFCRLVSLLGVVGWRNYDAAIFEF